MTLIFLSPIAERITENSVCSSPPPAPPESPPAAGIATAIGAAAETPHFSSSILARSAASITVRFDNSSANFSRSAIVFYSKFKLQEQQ